MKALRTNSIHHEPLQDISGNNLEVGLVGAGQDQYSERELFTSRGSIRDRTGITRARILEKIRNMDNQELSSLNLDMENEENGNFSFNVLR